MAPINFEENIREKLEGREIQPSAETWKKLSSQLDTNDQKKDSKIIWYAIAASFVGIIIVASVFFSRQEQLVENDLDFVEVNTSEGNKLEDLQEINSVNLKKDEAETIASEDIEPIKLELNKVEIIEKPIQKKKEVLVQKNSVSKTSEAIAKLDIPVLKESIKPETKKPVLSEEETIMNAKVAEVIAKLEQLKINKTSISVEELDGLLANAQKEIQNQRLLSSKKVDPAALLGDVEMELEQSFRDKVYYALGDGFQFIKSAVVERNN